MRSAICISGLARTYKKTYESFMRNVVGPLKERGEVDIFISIWDTIDLIFLSSYATQEDKVDVNEIIRLYQPVAIDIEYFSVLRDSFQVDRLANKLIKNFIKGVVRDDILVAAPAQYKVMRCNAFKTVYEQLKRFKYDWVIRTRFDVDISPLRMDEMDSLKINCLYDYEGGVGDYFYIASSDNMNILSQLFVYYITLLSIDNIDMGPERNLKNYMNNMGLQSHIITNHNFALVREGFRQNFEWDDKVGLYIPSLPPSIELPMDKYSNVEINLEDIGKDCQTTIDGLNSIYICCLTGQTVTFEGYSDSSEFQWAKYAIGIFLQDKPEKLTIDIKTNRASFVKL